MIVITTPTGDIGSRVLSQVLEAGAEVRVVARDPGKLPTDVRKHVDFVKGSHADPAAIADMLDGAEAVFWLPPGPPGSAGPHEAYVEFSQAFVDALPGSEVRRVVGVSAVGRDWPEPAGHVTASVEMDRRIGATGVAYRALACVSLMDNMLRQAEPIRSLGMFFGPTPADLPQQHVAKSDVAQLSAELLLDGGWTGVEELPLCGPEDLSFNQMAEVVSDVLGRDVNYQPIPMDAFRSTMLEAGASPGMADAYVEMLSAKAAGMDAAGCAGERGLTPTTFREWCVRELRPAVEG